MKKCSKCGAELNDGVAFCGACGNAVNQEQPNYQGEPQKAKEASKAESFFQKLFDFSDKTSEFIPEDIEENKIMSLFAYIGFLFIIPLFATKGSKYARFHANQGLILFLCELAVGVVCTIINTVGGLFAAIPHVGLIIAGFIGFFASIIGFVAGLLLFVWAVLGIVNAITGKAKEIPFIGKWRILK